MHERVKRGRDAHSAAGLSRIGYGRFSVAGLRFYSPSRSRHREHIQLVRVQRAGCLGSSALGPFWAYDSMGLQDPPLQKQRILSRPRFSLGNGEYDD